MRPVATESWDFRNRVQPVRKTVSGSFGLSGFCSKQKNENNCKCSILFKIEHVNRKLHARNHASGLGKVNESKSWQKFCRNTFWYFGAKTVKCREPKKQFFHRKDHQKWKTSDWGLMEEIKNFVSEKKSLGETSKIVIQRSFWEKRIIRILLQQKYFNKLSRTVFLKKPSNDILQNKMKPAVMCITEIDTAFYHLWQHSSETFVDQEPDRRNKVKKFKLSTLLETTVFW